MEDVVVVVCQGLAVIGAEEDGGVLVEALLAQRLDDPSDERVRGADLAGVDRVELQQVGLGEHVPPEDHVVEIAPEGHVQLARVGLGVELRVPGLARIEGIVGVHEVEPEEERLIGGPLLQDLHHLVHQDGVGGEVVDVPHLALPLAVALAHLIIEEVAHVRGQPVHPVARIAGPLEQGGVAQGGPVLAGVVAHAMVAWVGAREQTGQGDGRDPAGHDGVHDHRVGHERLDGGRGLEAGARPHEARRERVEGEQHDHLLPGRVGVGVVGVGGLDSGLRAARVGSGGAGQGEEEGEHHSYG